MYTIHYKIRKFVVCCLLIEAFLLCAFTTLNIFVFYIAFESILLPMFLLIGVWGSRSRKIQAAYFLVLYTLVFSFFMLYALIFLYT